MNVRVVTNKDPDSEENDFEDESEDWATSSHSYDEGTSGGYHHLGSDLF